MDRFGLPIAFRRRLDGFGLSDVFPSAYYHFSEQRDSLLHTIVNF